MSRFWIALHNIVWILCCHSRSFHNLNQAGVRYLLVSRSVAKPVTMDYLFNVKRVLRIFFYNFFTKYFVLLSNISVYQLLFTKKGVGLNFRIVFSSPVHRSNTGNHYVGTHLVPLVQATSVLVGTQVFKIVFPLRALVAQVGGAAASGERIRISFGFERLPPLARHQMSLLYLRFRF